MNEDIKTINKRPTEHQVLTKNGKQGKKLLYDNFDPSYSRVELKPRRLPKKTHTSINHWTTETPPLLVTSKGKTVKNKEINPRPICLYT